MWQTRMETSYFQPHRHHWVDGRARRRRTVNEVRGENQANASNFVTVARYCLHSTWLSQRYEESAMIKRAYPGNVDHAPSIHQSKAVLMTMWKTSFVSRPQCIAFIHLQLSANKIYHLVYCIDINHVMYLIVHKNASSHAGRGAIVDRRNTSSEQLTIKYVSWRRICSPDTRGDSALEVCYVITLNKLTFTLHYKYGCQWLTMKWSVTSLLRLSCSNSRVK